MKTLYILSTCALMSASVIVTAQNFENGSLEGEVQDISQMPDGWEPVPFTDLACRADEPFKATPDLTNYEGLPTSVDISGTAQEGETFISALDFGPGWHHEGFQQRVDGLIPGQIYRITFYQAVIKQDNALDTSGSWSVYMDNALLEISSVTTSNVPFNSRDTEWEKRSMEFKAKSESHLFKFLPVDDDNVYNHFGEDGNLRMGIDNISIEELLDFEYLDDLEMSVFPNPTLAEFTVSTDLEKYELLIMDTAGRIVYQQQNCSYFNTG